MPLKDPELRKAYLRAYYLRRKAADSDYNKKAWLRIKNNPVKHKQELERRKDQYHNGNRKFYEKNYQLKRDYGITLDEYNKMLQEQNSCCCICGRHQSEFKKALHVEHNHITGKVRGIVCSYCNHSLSVLEDDFLFPKLVEYLEKNDEL